VDPINLRLQAGQHETIAGNPIPSNDVPASGLVEENLDMTLTVYELHDKKGTADYYTALAINCLLKVGTAAFLRQAVLPVTRLASRCVARSLATPS
jgi:hypothetical protein